VEDVTEEVALELFKETDDELSSFFEEDGREEFTLELSDESVDEVSSLFSEEVNVDGSEFVSLLFITVEWLLSDSLDGKFMFNTSHQDLD
jgi:hypothetical protein